MMFLKREMVLILRSSISIVKFPGTKGTEAVFCRRLSALRGFSEEIHRPLLKEKRYVMAPFPGAKIFLGGGAIFLALGLIAWPAAAQGPEAPAISLEKTATPAAAGKDRKSVV